MIVNYFQKKTEENRPDGRISPQRLATNALSIHTNWDLYVLAIELDGKEHFEDEIVKERDQKKNAICQAHQMQIIRVENAYARRYHHIKEILINYFSVWH